MEQITITLPLPEACTLLEWLYQRNSREDLPERCFSHFGEKAALWSLECLLEAALILPDVVGRRRRKRG